MNIVSSASRKRMNGNIVVIHLLVLSIPSSKLTKKVLVRYFITSDKTDEDSANENLIYKSFGYDNLTSDFALEAYSEVTIEVWEEELKLGGHDLIDEFKSFVDKYLILIIKEID